MVPHCYSVCDFGVGFGSTLCYMLLCEISHREIALYSDTSSEKFMFIQTNENLFGNVSKWTRSYEMVNSV